MAAIYVVMRKIQYDSRIWVLPSTLSGGRASWYIAFPN